jgi:methylated-DNA-[protein]-cysteine S-methyltransferase
MNTTTQRYFIFETAHGFCGVAWHDGGITSLRLPTKTADTARYAVLRRVPNAEPATPTPEVADAIAAVKRYFAGEATRFDDVKLDLGDQDPFFEQIYAAVRKLAWGQTTSYGALAKELGAGPEAARDVGQAMAKNPVPLIVPCHRVLAAGGKLGGFSAPGGSTAKARMLKLEGVRLDPPPPAQTAFGF